MHSSAPLSPGSSKVTKKFPDQVKITFEKAEKGQVHQEQKKRLHSPVSKNTNLLSQGEMIELPALQNIESTGPRHPCYQVATSRMEIRPLGVLPNDYCGNRPIILVRVDRLSYQTASKTINTWIPFYLSTGTSSGKANRWFPFYGFAFGKTAHIWIMKGRNIYTDKHFIYDDQKCRYPTSDYSQIKEFGRQDEFRIRMEGMTALQISARLRKELHYDPIHHTLSKRIQGDGDQALYLLELKKPTQFNTAIEVNNGYGVDFSKIPASEEGTEKKAKRLDERIKDAKRSRRNSLHGALLPWKQYSRILRQYQYDEAKSLPTIDEIICATQSNSQYTSGLTVSPE